MISDYKDLEAEGVLVADLNENGNDVHLKRIAVADLVEVLLLKVRGSVNAN